MSLFHSTVLPICGEAAHGLSLGPLRVLGNNCQDISSLGPFIWGEEVGCFQDCDGVIPLGDDHASQMGSVDEVLVDYARLTHDLGDLPQLGIVACLVS